MCGSEVGCAVCGLGVGGKTYHILLGSENRALCEISIAEGPGGTRTPSDARALVRAVPGAVGQMSDWRAEDKSYLS